jgi:hypothetical protein
MALRYTHLSSGHKQHTIRVLEGYGRYVRAMLPAGLAWQTGATPQVSNVASMGR